MKREKPEKKAVGRPSKYSQEVAEAICAGIMKGKGLRAICKDAKMPNCSTVFYWLQKNEEFSKQYARAREIQAELMADEICEIADDATNDFMEVQRKNGQVDIVVDQENIGRSKLRVEARKWAASKLLPKKYGDKVTTDITSGGQPLAAPVLNISFVNAGQ